MYLFVKNSSFRSRLPFQWHINIKLETKEGEYVRFFSMFKRRRLFPRFINTTDVRNLYMDLSAFRRYRPSLPLPRCDAESGKKNRGLMGVFNARTRCNPGARTLRCGSTGCRRRPGCPASAPGRPRWTCRAVRRPRRAPLRPPRRSAWPVGCRPRSSPTRRRAASTSPRLLVNGRIERNE